MKNGEIISNIYNSVCQRQSEKTEAILKILEEDNEWIEGLIGDYLNILNATDLNKILSFKGLKKTDISSIINKYSFSG